MTTPLRPCGTPAAYKRHRDYGQEPCPKCQDAKQRYNATLAQARKDQAAMFRKLIDLIAGVCREEGMLP